MTYNIHVPPPEGAVVILPYLDENESQLLPHYSISIFSENNFFPPWRGRGSWVWVGQLLRFKLFLFIGKIKVAILSLPPDDVSVEQWLALFLAMPKVRVRISAGEFYLKNLFLSRNRQAFRIAYQACVDYKIRNAWFTT